MRIFLAVDLPEAVKNQISLIQAELKKSAADVGWVVPEKFHFTLKFIGEMTEQKITPLAAGLEKVLKGEKKFMVSLGEIGAFPNFEKMRVVWIGVSRGEEDLKKLAQKAEEASVAAGAAPENRPFSGHLTLGRVRSLKNSAELKNKISEIKAPAALDFEVDRVKIFQSILKPAGSEYVVLKEITFKDEKVN